MLKIVKLDLWSTAMERGELVIQEEYKNFVESINREPRIGEYLAGYIEADGNVMLLSGSEDIGYISKRLGIILYECVEVQEDLCYHAEVDNIEDNYGYRLDKTTVEVENDVYRIRTVLLAFDEDLCCKPPEEDKNPILYEKEVEIVVPRDTVFYRWASSHPVTVVTVDQAMSLFYGYLGFYLSSKTIKFSEVKDFRKWLPSLLDKERIKVLLLDAEYIKAYSSMLFKHPRRIGKRYLELYEWRKWDLLCDYVNFAEDYTIQVCLHLHPTDCGDNMNCSIELIIMNGHTDVVDVKLNSYLVQKYNWQSIKQKNV